VVGAFYSRRGGELKVRAMPRGVEKRLDQIVRNKQRVMLGSGVAHLTTFAKTEGPTSR
jgi:hypothetical protein